MALQSDYQYHPTGMLDRDQRTAMTTNTTVNHKSNNSHQQQNCHEIRLKSTKVPSLFSSPCSNLQEENRHCIKSSSSLSSSCELLSETKDICAAVVARRNNNKFLRVPKICQSKLSHI